MVLETWLCVVQVEDGNRRLAWTDQILDVSGCGRQNDGRLGIAEYSKAALASPAATGGRQWHRDAAGIERAHEGGYKIETRREGKEHAVARFREPAQRERDSACPQIDGSKGQAAGDPALAVKPAVGNSSGIACNVLPDQIDETCRPQEMPPNGSPLMPGHYNGQKTGQRII